MFESQAAALVIEGAGESADLRDLIGRPEGIASVEAVSAATSVSADPHENLRAFLARLRGMSRSERILASRYRFSLWELNVWSAHYMEEVPRINGELEWIAATLADNE